MVFDIIQLTVTISDFLQHKYTNTCQIARSHLNPCFIPVKCNIKQIPLTEIQKPYVQGTLCSIWSETGVFSSF